MKLIIQIPCYNEAGFIAATLKALPDQVAGFEKVESLIVDDGSDDETISVARQAGVDHVVSHTHNLGLARAFKSGIQASLDLGADVIVNTDADNQYCAEDIVKLVTPICNHKADMVVGERPIATIEDFSNLKKILQRWGSWVVRLASGSTIPDAPSGFRAWSREAALQINVFGNYTYTLETIIQAGQKNMAIVSVPIRVNKEVRASRLVKNIPSYLMHSMVTIVRIFVVYQPFRFFMLLASFLLMAGAGLGLRFLYFLLVGEGSGHIQSVILAGTLMGMGVQTVLVAFLADLMAVNRKLLEKIDLTVKRVNKDG